MKRSVKILSLCLFVILTMTLFVTSVSAKSADYSSIYTYIDTCVPKDNDAGIYSATSYGNLMNVVDAIDYSLTSDKQDVVDNYLTQLKNAVSSLETDESKAVADFGIDLSKLTAKCGDVIDVTLTLKTNYNLYAVSSIIVYDSNVFEVVADSTTSSTGYLDYSGDLANYLHLGNWKSPDNMYSRNNNTTYWNQQKNNVKLAYIAMSGDSTLGDPVATSGRIASFQLRVKDGVADGTVGRIYMSSDFIKNSSCKAGLTFASRAVGTYFSSASDAYIQYGQTINLSDADKSVTIGDTHICTAGDWTVLTPATCTENGIKVKKCSGCEKEIERDIIPFTGHTEETIPSVPSTCTKAGLSEGIKCSVCKKILKSQTELPLKSHTFGEWKVTKAATYAVAGVETRECTSCHKKETRETAKVKFDISNFKILNARATVSGSTITLTGYTNTTTVVVYTNTKDSQKVTVFNSGTPITLSKDGTGYLLSYENWKKNGSKLSVIVSIGGLYYNLEYKFVTVAAPTKDHFKTYRVFDIDIDNNNKTISMTSNIDQPYINFYVNPDIDKSFTYTLPDSTQVEKVGTSSYKILCPTDGNTVTLPVSVKAGILGTTEYTLVVTFVKSPIVPSKFIVPVNGGIELCNNGEEYYILVTKKQDCDYFGIRSTGISGSTLFFDPAATDGVVDSYSSRGSVVQYRIYENKNIKPGDTEPSPVTGTITITFKDGKTETYKIIFSFKPMGFSESAFSSTQVQSLKYDSTKKTLVLNGATNETIFIRDALTNGLGLTIKEVDGKGISYSDSIYSVKCPASGVSYFTIVLADGTEIACTALFKDHCTVDESGKIVGDKINISRLNALRGTFAYDDNSRLVCTVSSGKSAVTINKTTTTGESVYIKPVAGMTETDTGYVISNALSQTKFTMVISGVEYDFTALKYGDVIKEKQEDYETELD